MMERSSPKHRLPGPAVAVIAAAAAILVLLAAYCGLCKWVRDNGRLLPGTVARDPAGAATLDLGGLTRDEAVERLSAYMDNHMGQRALTIRYGAGKSAALSGSLLESDPERAVRIPMRPGARCLNLSNAVAVVVYEVLRQRDFSGLQEQGKLVR